MRLHHKNIVEVYEVITDDDYIYIIMEYLAGGELFDKIKERGRLEENLAKTWFKEIVEAVKYIHDVSTNIIIRNYSLQTVLIRYILERYCAQRPEAGKWYEKWLDSNLSNL